MALPLFTPFLGSFLEVGAVTWCLRVISASTMNTLLLLIKSAPRDARSSFHPSRIRTVWSIRSSNVFSAVGTSHTWRMSMLTVGLYWAEISIVCSLLWFSVGCLTSWRLFYFHYQVLTLACSVGTVRLHAYNRTRD